MSLLPTLRSLRLLLAAAIVLWLAVGSGVAFGQAYPVCNRKPSPSDVEGAKGAHLAAKRFYDKGEYDNAIKFWETAYGFDCTAHRLLINIGNAYEKLGNKQRAITAFETYVKRAGRGADQTIKDKVVNLKKQLHKVEPIPTAPTATTTGTDIPIPPPDEDDDEPSNVGPWILVGTGGAVTLIGAILLGVGTGKVSEAEAECDDHKCPPGKEEYADIGNTGRILTGIGGVSLGLGLAAVAGGLVWYFVSGSDDDESADEEAASFSVTPVAGPGYGGIGIGGRF